MDWSKHSFPSGTMLGEMGSAARLALASIWHVSEFGRGNLIMSAEESGSDICFLLSGQARIALFTASGREISVNNLATGDCFGEFSAIDGAPRSASIEALGPCFAARIPGDRFRSLLKSNPDLSYAFLVMLVEKLRALTAKVSDFNEHNADWRIRQEILRLAEAAPGEGDRRRLDRPPTQTEIAARVFSNREAVAREMGAMKRKGLIGRDGRALTVPSLDALRDFVDAE